MDCFFNSFFVTLGILAALSVVTVFLAIVGTIMGLVNKKK